MTLDEFLLARIAEDDDAARYALDADSGFVADHDVAKCEALRRIVGEHTPTPTPTTRMAPGCRTCSTAQGWDNHNGQTNCLTLRLLAVPYADHPDCNEDWRP